MYNFVGGLGLVSGRGKPRLLKLLCDFPGRDFTINGLAKEAEVPFASAWRAVRDWEAAGFVQTRVLGRARVVRLSNEQYASSLLNAAFVPSLQQSSLGAVRQALSSEPRVKRAFLFGSVAEGREKPGSDLDVALLVEKEFDVSPLVNKVFDETGCKLIALQFSSTTRLEAFLKGKKSEELK